MNERICILPRLEGLGGPSSFQSRLINGLEKRSVHVTHDPNEPAVRAVLVIGGTSRVHELINLRRRGVRIVQRLNGMNWIHRRMNTGLKHYFKSEYNNLLLATIRRHLADSIVYQSQFSRSWWNTVYGSIRQPNCVVYNGIDLSAFTPNGAHRRPENRFRILLVEGRLGGGNEQGLQNAILLARELDRRMPGKVELTIAGDVPPGLQNLYAGADTQKRLINWAGVVKRSDVPFLDRSAHVLFSADLNAACPNSVIEAMACGLPVIAFSTGSLPELIENGAGIVAPYGSNYWALEPPGIPPLADAAQKVFEQQESFRPAARARAESAFGLDPMLDGYLAALLG